MHASKLQYPVTTKPTTARNPTTTSTPSSSATTTTTSSSSSSSTTPLDPVSLRANITDLLTCLNSRHYHLLPLFLSPSTLTYNSSPSSPASYSAYLQALIASAPDMSFKLGQMVVDRLNRRVACVLAVEGTPAAAKFRGHAVAGGVKKVRYFEHVTWAMDAEGRIEGVESAVDEEAVARQCAKGRKRA